MNDAAKWRSNIIMMLATVTIILSGGSLARQTSLSLALMDDYGQFCRE